MLESMQIHFWRYIRMYNAVGIDVSKGKSTVAVLQPGGTVIRKPFDVSHTSQNLNELAELSGFTGWRYQNRYGMYRQIP